VSGIDPQTLVLVRGEDLQTVRSLPLSSDFRREVLLRFGPSGRFLYLEQEDALEVMEPLRERTARLELPGRLTSFAAGPRFAVAASSRGDTASLVVFRPMASAVARAAPARQVAWSMVSGTSLFVGLEDRLFRADVMEE
jgi:hypothetical protein